MGLNEGKKIFMSVYRSESECRSGVDSSCFSLNQLSSEDTTTREKVPSIVPCYNGKSLKIHEDLVNNGLCAISIRHHMGRCRHDRRISEDINHKRWREDENKENELSRVSQTHEAYKILKSDMPECLKGKMKRRNSFWSIHRPELSKLTWPENFVTSAVLQDFFHNHLQIHGTFCEPLHECSNQLSLLNEEIQDYSKLREIIPPRILPPDEKGINIVEKSRSFQLNDEDLDPEAMVHKSRAEFCVTIGEYIRRPALKRTISQQMPKSIQPTNRMESLPPAKDGRISNERVSGTSDFRVDIDLRKKPSKKLNAGNISGTMLRRSSGTDLPRTVMTSSSLNNLHSHYNNQVTEDSGDPAPMRTILSPRDETNEGTRSRHCRM